MTKLRGIPFSNHFNVHQYATIAPGETARVFWGKIPSSCVGFIYKIGNNSYENTYYTWIIDSAIVERRIERMIGEIDNPQVYDDTNGGPWLVLDHVEWTATNNDTVSREFEVLVDGVIFQKVRRI